VFAVGSGHALNQQRHLLVLLIETALLTVGQASSFMVLAKTLRTHSSKIHTSSPVSLVGAEKAFVLAGEGISRRLQKAAGTYMMGTGRSTPALEETVPSPPGE